MRQWTKVDPLQVKAAIQATLAWWDRPERIRLDNGAPWGTQSQLPSALGLWLVGLAIDLIYGRPARCTDNAVVERSQGVLTQWVEPQQCTDRQDCQLRLAWAVKTQRERYRRGDGQTRRQAYPGLSANLRGYDPRQDSRQWSMDRVHHYLSQFCFRRKVETNGHISFFANNYGVGRAYARQYIEIQLDDLTNQWVIRDEYGKEIRRHDPKELTYAQISQLRLAKRRRS